MNAYLDTATVLRLANKELGKISKEAHQSIERYDLLVSPMVLLELQYAFELKRIKLPAETVFVNLQRTIDLQVCRLPFEKIAQVAWRESWTRDAFDRIIVSQARYAGNAYLITPDETIGKNYEQTIW